MIKNTTTKNLHIDMTTKQRWIVSLLFLVQLTAFGQSAPTKPNIVFIMADDLGWGELGCYGNTFNETPNLDKMAADGIRFTQAYAAAPLCSPTRASIMTGQVPARVGITDFLPGETERFLDPAKYVTVNEALATAGYRTAIVGKWHLETNFKDPKGDPKQNGFQEVIGSETKYIADGDYFFPYDKISTFSEGRENEYLTDRQFAEGAKFIERNKKQPFFLYLSLYSVHTLLEAPESTVAKFKQKFDTKYGAGTAEKFFETNNARHESNHKDNPYLAAMLEHIDAGVGRIVETLKKNGLDKNTLVVFFSDNGGAGKVANNGHLRAGKTWLYEGGIRECLVMKWPGQIKPGTETDAVVSSIDFYPTFLQMAGVKPSKEHIVDGQSILPLLTKGTSPKREALYWHYPSETGKWVPRMASAVRKGDYKLLEFYVDGRLELYDLKNDAGEKNNLASSNPEKVKELKKMLDQWKKEVNAEAPVLTPNKKVAKH